MKLYNNHVSFAQASTGYQEDLKRLQSCLRIFRESPDETVKDIVCNLGQHQDGYREGDNDRILKRLESCQKWKYVQVIFPDQYIPETFFHVGQQQENSDKDHDAFNGEGE